MPTDRAPETLLEAVTYFANEDVAFAFVTNLRWPTGKQVCPRCAAVDTHNFVATRRVWKCRNCRKQFSLKQGTIFEDSPLSLSKWLPAMWMLANCKNGISSHELARALGITQKSAWFMLHRIRLAMQSDTFQKIDGEVEVDETYIGGKARNMHKDKRARVIKGRGGIGKVAVMGLLARHKGKTGGKSRVRTKILKQTNRVTMQGEVREHVQPGAEVFSDAHSGYTGLDREYIHKVVDHAECYVRGNVHTNGLENFWSLLKRGLKGTYVSVEPFHLFRYLDEQVFRFNERETTDRGRFLMVAASIFGKRIMYRNLIGQGLAKI
jgi:transposase-like protein